MTEGLLSGIKVVDLTQYVAGPYCTKLLASLGAEVIKVEKPGVGDGARRMGPFPDDIPHLEKSALFLYLNTAKKSVTLNLKAVAGKELFLRLAKDADVLAEGFPPRGMPRLGLSYRRLRRVNPRLVMTSITNFGQRGPYRHYKAQELNLYAAGGLMYINGEEDREPLKAGPPLAQYAAGQVAFAATLVGLWHRMETGEGQHIDLSIAEVGVSQVSNALGTYTYMGQVVPRTGNRGYGRAAWGIYPCRDGHVGIIAGPDHRWPAVAQLMGREELEHPLFSTREGRRLYAEEVEVLMQPWLDQNDKLDIFLRGQELGLAFSFVAGPKEILEMEHLRARDYFVTLDHPEAGKMEYPGPPYRTGEGGWQFQRAPRLGEHNREVYCGRLGLARQELVRLRQGGVI